MKIAIYIVLALTAIKAQAQTHYEGPIVDMHVHVAVLAIGHPQTQFIIAHMGFVHYRELLTIQAWKRYPWYKSNIWMDVSAIAPIMGDSPEGAQIRWVIRQIGVGQFLYGSDFPLFSFK